ncbi:ABC transporter permease [Paenibacillus lautus]|uniref:ABC transporter permease n=1 Tax=Paenibacillus lautus TaxID=1401 RepID=UPI003D9A8544
MLNLLRAEGYKLRRSKLFYITLGCVVILTVIAVLQSSIGAEPDKGSGQANLVLRVYYPFHEVGLLPSMLPAFQAVFITMFLTAEFGTGTIRDAVVLGYRRVPIYLSKLAIASFGSVVMLAAALFSAFAAAFLVVGRSALFSFTELLALLRSMSVLVLLFLAFASLFVMLAFLIRNTGGTMAVCLGVILVCGFAVSGAGRNWWPMMHISNVAVPNPDGGAIRWAVFVAFVYLSGCSIAGGILFSKQDIK